MTKSTLFPVLKNSSSPTECYHSLKVGGSMGGRYGGFRVQGLGFRIFLGPKTPDP